MVAGYTTKEIQLETANKNRNTNQEKEKKHKARQTGWGKKTFAKTKVKKGKEGIRNTQTHVETKRDMSFRSAHVFCFCNSNVALVGR